VISSTTRPVLSFQHFSFSGSGPAARGPPKPRAELKDLPLPVLLPRPSQTIDPLTNTTSQSAIAVVDSFRPGPPSDVFRHHPDATGVADIHSSMLSAMTHESSPGKENWQ
jgi:hypothetical protein